MRFMAVSVDKENLFGWKNFYDAATDFILRSFITNVLHTFHGPFAEDS